MQETKFFFSQDLYEKHLSTINNVHFTNREIDVIACLLNARGTSKIAFLLSVNPRTVETHVRNIMSKLECNTREGIIDFIEASDKLPFLRKYYSLLQNEIIFKKSLKDISKLNKNRSPRCLLIQDKDTDSFIFHLKSYLELADITVSVGARDKKGDHTIFALPKILTEEAIASLLTKIRKSQNKVFLLLREKKNPKEIPQELMQWDVIDFAAQENYFFAIFLILSKLLPHLDLDKIIAEFKEKYKKEPTDYKFLNVSLNEAPSGNRSIYRRWSYLILICFLCAFTGTGFLIFDRNQKNNDEPSLRSDLTIPVESVFLNRPELITQIDSAFKDNEGIQAVALVGIGGAGKTTLARQYADQQKANLIWEINAETPTSLSESFKSLAQAFSKTEEDKKILRELEEIKQPAEREKRLIQFVRERLKLHSNWFLIYDNVEDFADLQSYFPKDMNTWGEGKVILTTRNHNIQNNRQVNGLVLVGELSPAHKLDLFMQIMQQSKDYKLTIKKRKELAEFLKQLPPFPLDISVAAYYLKTLNISYAEYLESLQQQDKDFTVVQENLLKEGGEYKKTRFAIITRSLEYLLKTHKDFADLLLFISLLDSQNIPKELLALYKSSSVVDNFIYHLKKHSLITNQALPSSSGTTYSIHRSTQAIALSYLEKLLKLNGESSLLKEIVSVLDDYADKNIEQEDFLRMQIMVRHLEKILSHPNLLTDFSKGLLESKLGSSYYFINNDKSKKLLDNSLKILQTKSLERISAEDVSRPTRALLHIGAIYTELRLYKEAEELFKKAINIYQQEGIKNYTDSSWALSHLGNVHRRLGNYETARDYLEKSINLHNQYGVDKKRMARTLAYLGSVYRGLGLYQKSVDSLEESLAIYNKNYSNDHFRIGWTLTRLGNVYSDLGDFKKAKHYFEKGLLISKKYFPEDHVSMALTLTYLGNCYRELGDYEKSRDSLEESLKIHQKHFDANYRRMAWVLFYLATTYKALGNNQEAQKMYDRVLEIYANYCNEDNIEVAGILRNMAKVCLDKNRFDEAEGFIKRSLKILQSRQHVDAYRSLEVLGEIYLKRSTQSTHVKNNEENQHLKVQASDLFNQALEITEQNFPKDSAHVERIKLRIKKMKE